MSGDSVEDPKIVNLKEPEQLVTMYTAKGPMKVNMIEFAEAAKHLGLGDIQKGDVLSIGAYRNGKGEWAPDYSLIQIERGTS